MKSANHCILILFSFFAAAQHFGIGVVFIGFISSVIFSSISSCYPSRSCVSFCRLFFTFCFTLAVISCLFLLPPPSHVWVGSLISFYPPVSNSVIHLLCIWSVVLSPELPWIFVLLFWILFFHFLDFDQLEQKSCFYFNLHLHLGLFTPHFNFVSTWTPSRLFLLTAGVCALVSLATFTVLLDTVQLHDWKLWTHFGSHTVAHYM